MLRELISIPERVHQGDFVLRLTEGVARRQATLDSYVITPQLRVAFDEALGLIGSALAEQRSKASYLHGSFGSGKSHFMAVLHALLDGDVAARSRHELADLVGRHSWLGDTRFLLVPYHLIGAESLEAAILGGYVNHIRRAHPDAPLPAVYRAQGLLADARAIRDRMGTEAFLAELPASGDPGWGEVDSGWSAAELDEAFDADPGSELAQRLISDVVPTFLPSYVDSVAGAASAFVPLDAGLAALSNHARSLGYDGVVLFLDELVLCSPARSPTRRSSAARPRRSPSSSSPQTRTARCRSSASSPGSATCGSWSAPSARGRGALVPGSAVLLGRPVRHRHAGGPEPAGDRRCQPYAARFATEPRRSSPTLR